MNPTFGYRFLGDLRIRDRATTGTSFLAIRLVKQDLVAGLEYYLVLRPKNRPKGAVSMIGIAREFAGRLTPV